MCEGAGINNGHLFIILAFSFKPMEKEWFLKISYYQHGWHPISWPPSKLGIPKTLIVPSFYLDKCWKSWQAGWMEDLCLEVELDLPFWNMSRFYSLSKNCKCSLFKDASQKVALSSRRKTFSAGNLVTLSFHSLASTKVLTWPRQSSYRGRVRPRLWRNNNPLRPHGWDLLFGIWHHALGIWHRVFGIWHMDMVSEIWHSEL